MNKYAIYVSVVKTYQSDAINLYSTELSMSEKRRRCCTHTQIDDGSTELSARTEGSVTSPRLDRP